MFSQFLKHLHGLLCRITVEQAPSGALRLLPSPYLQKLTFQLRSAMEWWNTPPRPSAGLHCDPLEPAAPEIRQEAARDSWNTPPRAGHEQINISEPGMGHAQSAMEFDTPPRTSMAARVLVPERKLAKFQCPAERFSTVSRKVSRAREHKRIEHGSMGHANLAKCQYPIWSSISRGHAI